MAAAADATMGEAEDNDDDDDDDEEVDRDDFDRGAKEGEGVRKRSLRTPPPRSISAK